MDGLFDNPLLIFAALFLIGIICLAAWLTAQHLGGSGVSFFHSRVKRLGLVEEASIGSGRRLLLIRRDDVEHLIMTGGPIDVVVEVGIEASQRNGMLRESPPRHRETPMYSKPGTPPPPLDLELDLDDTPHETARPAADRNEALTIDQDEDQTEKPRREKLATPTLSKLLSVVENKINPKKTARQTEESKPSEAQDRLTTPIELGDESHAEKIQ